MKKNIGYNKISNLPNKFFTVIIPCFNGQKFIAQAINSVLKQTFSDFELIIVNDGSTDGTLKAIEHFAKQDKRIRVVSNKKNRGLSFSRNKGLDLARGRFVAFLDSDDWWPEEKLTTYAHAHMQGHDLVFSNYDIVIQGSNKTIKEVKVPTSLSCNDLKYSNSIPLSSAAYNFEKIPHKRFQSIDVSEDWCFWLDSIKYLNHPIGIQKSLMFYRRHNDNISKNKIKMIKKTWDIFRNKHKWSVMRSIYGIFRYLMSKFQKYYI